MKHQEKGGQNDELRAYGISTKGRVRSENEDALLVETQRNVYAVADGIGGLPSGAEASQHVVNLLQEGFDASSTTSDSLRQIVSILNQSLIDTFEERYPFTGVGTTLTMVEIREQAMHVAHVGDSAAYLLGSDRLEKITANHTLEQKFIDEHGVNAKSDMPSEYTHTLTQCLGQTPHIKADVIEYSIKSKDRILICSDGLYRELSEIEIERVLSSSETPKAACEELVDAANRKEGNDNITVVVLFIE